MWKDRKEDHVVYQVRDADTLKQGYGSKDRKWIQESFRR